MKKIYLFISLFSTITIFGQTNFLVENFDYTAGTLLTANGWNAHSGGTTNPVAVNAGGLTWTGYIGSNVGNAALVNNTGQDVNRPLSTNLSTGSVYASFLFRPSAEITSTVTSDYFFHFAKYTNETAPVLTSINSAFRARVFAVRGTTPATQFKLGLTFNSADFITANLTADLNNNTTYLVVVKYTFVDGIDNDTASLYVFAPGQTITTEPATPTIGPLVNTPTTATPPVPAPDLSPIQAVVLRQNTLGQNFIVDGIYVRNTWNLTDPGLNTDDFDKNNSISLYPNPTNNGIVSFNSDLNGNKNIQMYDISGREVLNTNISENSFNVDGFNSGVYLVKITSENKSYTSKLIIK